MDKYVILTVLNLPFVIWGFVKTFSLYRTGRIQRAGLLSRLLFWTIILTGLVFARELYNFVFTHDLTDSTPLSLADVLLVTGVIFCIFLIFRVYTKVALLEQRVSDLQEKLSIKLSEKK